MTFSLDSVVLFLMVHLATALKVYLLHADICPITALFGVLLYHN